MTLSAREGAGLYLIRRARTLAAPHQLRLLATALLGTLTLDLVRIELVGSTEGAAVSWGSVACQALSYLAIAVVLWHPRTGAIVTAAALGGGVPAGGTGLEPLLLIVVGTVVALRGSARLVVLTAAGAGGFVVVEAALHPEHLAFIAVWFAGTALVGLICGRLLRRFLAGRDRDGRSEAETVAEDSRLREDERRILSRELHDVVTHQLSNVSLQLMSHADSSDPDELRSLMRRVDRSTTSALTELRLLARVLRHDLSGGPVTDDVADLSRRVAPTHAAAGWARRLTAAGFEPVIEVPGRVDTLEMTLQQSVTRAVDVSCANLARHAPPRSRCTVSVSLGAGQVVVRTSNPLPEADPSPAAGLGWGLRGLRERVDLLGGTFTAGPVTAAPSADGSPGREWVVVVTLPLD